MKKKNPPKLTKIAVTGISGKFGMESSSAPTKVEKPVKQVSKPPKGKK